MQVPLLHQMPPSKMVRKLHHIANHSHMNSPLNLCLNLS